MKFVLTSNHINKARLKMELDYNYYYYEYYCYHYYYYYHYYHYYYFLFFCYYHYLFIYLFFIIIIVIIIIIFFFGIRRPIRPEGSPFGRFYILGCCELKEVVSTQTYLNNPSMQPSRECLVINWMVNSCYGPYQL